MPHTLSVPTKLVYLIGRNEERTNTLLFNDLQSSAFNSLVNYRRSQFRAHRTHATCRIEPTSI